MKITVNRGKDHWEVTESDLGKLPADVRPHVGRLLGRGTHGWFYIFPQGSNLPGPPAAGIPVPEIRPEVRLEKRMEVLERRLEQMHKTLDEACGGSHHEAKDSPEKK